MTDLEKCLEGKPDPEVKDIVNHIIEEGAKSEFGDWIRIHLKSRRNYLYSALESGRLDPNDMLRLSGELRGLTALEAAFFSPLQVVGEELPGDEING